MSVYTGNLNDLSEDQFIITDKDIYRKINGYLYMLSSINDRYVWSANYGKSNMKGSEILNSDRLSYKLMHSTLVGEDTPYNFLSIYKADDNNHLIHTTTFSGYDVPFYWGELHPDHNQRCLQISSYLSSTKLISLPTHIDLTQHCSEEYEHEQALEQDGWQDLINNEGWLCWASPAPAPVAPGHVDEPECASSYEKAQALSGWSNPTEDNVLSWNGPGPSTSPAENLRRYLHRETAEQETADNETADNETADNETAEQETAEQETAEQETADNETAEQETAVPDEDDFDVEMTIYLEDVFEEERIDPYDGEWYAESEFYEYYGGDAEWTHQDPKKVLLREEYFKFTNTFSYLGAKKFIFLFNKYDRTFR